MDPLLSYLTCCRPYRFDPPWNFLEADSLAFRGPENPAEAFQWLGERHDPPELAARGLAVPDGNQQLRLHPILEMPDVPLIALQFADPHLAPALMCDQGCIGADMPPFAAAMQDLQTRVRLPQSDGRLLVTPCIDDVILLRALGLAAAPPGGLAELNVSGVKQLEKFFGSIGQAGSGEDNRWTKPSSLIIASPVQGAADSGSSDPLGGYQGTNEAPDDRGLVVADWRPMALSLESPPELAAVRRHLLDLEEFRGTDLTDFELWTPSPDQLRAIRFGLDQHAAEWVSDAILQSLHSGVRGFHQSRTASANDGERNDLALATERYSEEILKNGSDDSSRRKLKEAESDYRRLVIGEIVGPLLRLAQAELDPTERMRQFQVANLVNVSLMKFPGVLQAEVGGAAAGASGRSQEQALSELLRVIQQIGVLSGAQSRCKRYPATRAGRLRPRTIDALRSANLGLLQKS